MPSVNHSARLAASLITAMRGSSALTALVGSGSSARIYGGMAVQGASLPRVIFHDVSTLNSHTHDSATTSDAGIDESIVQFDCEARTLSIARQVVDEISALLNGAIITGGSATIQASFRDSGGFSQPMAYDSGDGVAEGHRISVDYRIFWKDTGYLRTPSLGYVFQPDGVSIFITP